MIATNQFTISTVYDGDQGVSVTKVVREYCKSNSSTSLPSTPIWTETEPQITSSEYLWARDRTDLSDGTSEYGPAICSTNISGVKQDIDRVKSSITNKIWSSDITTAIDNYDGSSVQTIRSRVSTNEQNISGITSRVSDVESDVISETNARKATYGTCSTATGTAAKVVSCSNFELYKGATISIKFQNANTIASPTLNVNSTGAKPIKSYTGTALSEGEYKWGAGATYDFVYDGTNWVMSDAGSTARISAAESTIIQNSNKIAAMVTVNGQASSLTLTDKMIEAMTNQFIVKGADGTTTVISGGEIQANSIKTGDIATDAIKSTNYTPGTPKSPYSTFGTFLDLSNGNFYTQNFGVKNTGTDAGAYINGEIIATAGRIGDDSNTAWDIGTFTDYEANDHGMIRANGDAFIQSGKWMISENSINTQWYGDDLKLAHVYDNTGMTYYDYGMTVPLRNTTDDGYIAPTVSENFLYIRKHENTIPSMETDWNYIFRVDKDGMIWINGKSLSQMISEGVDGGAYLPTSGGTVTGDVTITGTLAATASNANQLTHSISVNGKFFDGSSDTTVGTIGAAYGGTGQTSLINSANALLNALTIGSSIPGDNDYYISQYVNGGSTTTTYHRRPMSALWEYIKAKIAVNPSIVGDGYVLKTGDEIYGSLLIDNELIADSGNFSDLYVSGSARFANGLYGNLIGNVTGDLTGNATTATSAGKWTTAASITLGNTAKYVDGSNAVTWSRSEISGDATENSFGWMSAADKAKLDSIIVSDIGRVEASSIIGEKDISVVIKNGIAVISHMNEAITAGTISGTATSTLTNGGSFMIPSVTYDSYGHITKVGTTTLTLPTITQSDSAQKDGAGNIITSTYVNLTGTQTISGAKTFNGAVVMNNALTNKGEFVIQGATTGSNAYDSTNPKITFKNSAENQNIQLVMTDYDSVVSPASLTLTGNQNSTNGGEYFIAPNIRANTRIELGSNAYATYNSSSASIDFVFR